MPRLGGDLREDELAVAVVYALRVRVREQLHEAGVLREPLHALLHQRHVLRLDGRLARQLVATPHTPAQHAPEVEVDPQVEVVTDIVALQHGAVPLDERLRLSAPSRQRDVLHVGVLRHEHRRVRKVLGDALIRRPLVHTRHASSEPPRRHSLAGILLGLEVAAHDATQKRDRHAASHVDGVGQLAERLADVVLGHAVLVRHVQLAVALVHAELRHGEVAPAARRRGEVADPRHDAVEVAVVHGAARRLVQVHDVVVVGDVPADPRGGDVLQ